MNQFEGPNTKDKQNQKPTRKQEKIKSTKTKQWTPRNKEE